MLIEWRDCQRTNRKQAVLFGPEAAMSGPLYIPDPVEAVCMKCGVVGLVSRAFVINLYEIQTDHGRVILECEKCKVLAAREVIS